MEEARAAAGRTGVRAGARAGIALALLRCAGARRGTAATARIPVARDRGGGGAGLALAGCFARIGFRARGTGAAAGPRGAATAARAAGDGRARPTAGAGSKRPHSPKNWRSSAVNGSGTRCPFAAVANVRAMLFRIGVPRGTARMLSSVRALHAWRVTTVSARTACDLASAPLTSSFRRKSVPRAESSV